MGEHSEKEASQKELKPMELLCSLTLSSTGLDQAGIQMAQLLTDMALLMGKNGVVENGDGRVNERYPAETF